MPRKAKVTTAPKETPAPAPVEATPAPTNDVIAEPTLTDAFTTLLGQLTAMRSQITAITGQLRTLRARSEREIRIAQKNARKRRTANPNRKPSGFVKPALISTELASFLGKPKGTEMARTEVTREINQYIRANKLQDPANGRNILADNKLRKLLKLSKSDSLTYFNLQKYLSPHFPKTQAKA